MIFVCVGSREYPFDRLIRKVDELVADGTITDRVVGQIGQTKYEPRNFEWFRFMDRDAFRKCQEEADLIISHAGAGALVSALKMGKTVLAVPRLERYGEHIDDHQTQISGALAKEGYLREVLDMEGLGQIIIESFTDPVRRKYDKPSNIVPIIQSKLDEWIREGAL